MSKSEKFWNNLSKNYDKKAKDKTYEKILNKTLKYLQPNDHVLDFGCATGLYSFAFSRNVQLIHAFDTSSEMIQVAKNNALKNGNKNIIFAQTDLFDSNYLEGSIDTIFAFNILLYFEDVEQVLSRMNRLLKPDGLIITSTACLKESRTLIGTLSAIMITVLKALRVLPYLNFLKIDQLNKAIDNCGFTSIESEILIEKPAAEYYVVARKS